MGIAYNPSIVTSGLIFALDAGNTKSYPGSGTTWTDLSGNGNTGTLTNGPTYSSANGGSIVFDGVDDYVDLSTSVANISTNLSYDFWINLTSNPNNFYNGVFCRGRNPDPGGGTQTHSLIYIDPDESILFLLGKSDGTSNTINGGVLVFGTWYNYSCTFDGSFFNLYLNGSYVSQSSHTSTIYNTNQNRVRIGTDSRYDLAAGRQFNGRISNFKIYNRALTSSEVQQNFNALRGRYGI